MARLRKASPLEPSVFTPQPDQIRPRRSSPRKAAREVSYIISSDEDEENVPLRPKSLRHELGDPSSIFQNDSIFTTKSHGGPAEVLLTPRKQRILRPVESNSRLLRKLSDDTLASPEKKPGSGRRTRREEREFHGVNPDIGRKFSLMYSKSLARSVAGREPRHTNSRIGALDDSELQDGDTARPGDQVVLIESQKNKADSVDGTSMFCGEEADISQEAEQQQVESDNTTGITSEEYHVNHIIGKEEEEEEEVILPVRSRQRRRQRLIESDTESECEQENPTEDERQKPRLQMSAQPCHWKQKSEVSNWDHEVIDLTEHATDSLVLPVSTRARSSSLAISRPATSSSSEIHPFLTYSPTPTKKRSPCKAPPPIACPGSPTRTPPSPSKLVSPSKQRALIPKAPDLRSSLDAFWNPEAVNDWNERHSPVKSLVSPRKQQWRDDNSRAVGGVVSEDADSGDDAFTAQIPNNTKKAPQPQSAKDKSAAMVGRTVKQIRAQKKDFAERKHDIATSFLAELDNAVCSGRIAELSKATGGIKLIWSKTLKTTAGRANWRREVIRVKTSSSPPTYVSETRHHCSIELASKVIDDSSRLYNVLAHEFCHLLTFMISEVRNNPHGAEFKAWGRKVSAAFAEKGVEVTTKHSYTIDYKFVWECVDCGYEFKRHSRSVDTERHSCGKCKGRLIQTKPTPRSGSVARKGEGVKKSEYQVFVKENFSKVKEDMTMRGLDTPMGKVMEIVAKRYRDRRDAQQQEGTALNTLEHALIKLQL